jgi:adenylosuccinate synthase
MINGVTELYVTKPDVMNDFDTVKMCTAYDIDGQRTEEIPFEYNTANIVPVLTPYEGWKQSLEGITAYDQLPERLRTYLAAVEERTGVPIAAVSISPDRKDVVFK